VWRDTARRLRLGCTFGDLNGTGRVTPSTIAVVPTSELAPRQRRPGPPRGGAARRACGHAAYAAIVGAVELVRTGVADAVVTAPISKAHLTAAGHDFPGHTELLATLCGGVPVRMMMVGQRLRVVLVTTHLALADVPRAIDRRAVFETIVLTAD